VHGVPADLPLQSFVGAPLTQIGIGEYQLQFHFQGAGSITVEGGWKLVDSHQQQVDASQEHKEREAYRVHLLLGQTVGSFTVSPPDSFTLHFTSGYDLTVFDDSERYESFSLLGIYI
jgi:hypothetical protein